MSSENRKGYEFDQRTKDQAITAWHRDNPGREDEQLDVDHIIPIFRARELGLHPHEVNTLENARVLPRSEHQQRDHHEDLGDFLSKMTGFVGRLFD